MEQSFIPKNRILMGPGPSNVNPRVLEALKRPTIGHLDPQFIELMDDIKQLLQYTFQTDSNATIALSGPGSLGMEASLVNLIEPEDKVLIGIGGYFAGRMKQIVEKIGGVPIVVEAEWGRAIDQQKIEEALKNNPDIKITAIVHAETSTGALTDIKTISEIAHRYGSLLIADVVTSLGTCEILTKQWNLDAVYSCSQKGLSAMPGLSPISFSDAALQKIKNRTTPIKSWFNDLNLLMAYWSGEKRAYHHTAPANSFYGLHEAMLILKEEGLENSWRRHKENSVQLVKKLSSIGLEPLTPESERIPNLITVKVPEGINEEVIRKILLNDYSIEIGAGLGTLAGKVWRIGLMGYNSNEKMIELLIASLKDALSNKIV